jgi:hypothetical protein
MIKTLCEINKRPNMDLTSVILILIAKLSDDSINTAAIIALGEICKASGLYLDIVMPAFQQIIIDNRCSFVRSALLIAFGKICERTEVDVNFALSEMMRRFWNPPYDMIEMLGKVSRRADVNIHTIVPAILGACIVTGSGDDDEDSRLSVEILLDEICEIPGIDLIGIVPYLLKGLQDIPWYVCEARLKFLNTIFNKPDIDIISVLPVLIAALTRAINPKNQVEIPEHVGMDLSRSVPALLALLPNVDSDLREGGGLIYALSTMALSTVTQNKEEMKSSSSNPTHEAISKKRNRCHNGSYREGQLLLLL